jgi:hypothetical protein
MGSTDQQSYLTAFEVTFPGKRVSIPQSPVNGSFRGRRVVVAAALVGSILGLTSAAGALTRHTHKADFSAAMHSATFISLPTLGRVENNLY